MRKFVVTAIIVLGVLIAVTALAIVSGVYNVAADEEHSSLVYGLLETARERSIAARAANVTVPDLRDAQRVRRGAGNYDSMCAGCHLAPGAEDTELSRGLYPRPPDLVNHAQTNSARAFWIIKHGIKATGMPAWGKSMADEYIWDMVAFLNKLPTLSAEQYAAEVRASGGHSHGGGETMDEESEHGEGRGHAESADAHSHDDAASSEAEDHEHSGPTLDKTKRDHAHDEQGGSAARDGGPLATVKAFHDALSSGSAAGVVKMLDPKVLIMEGGNVERSRQEYASHHLTSDLKFMSTVTYKLERQSGDTIGDLAWVASETRLVGQSAAKPLELLSTESLVLRKRVDGWKIVHIHWSSRNLKEA